MNFQIPFFFAEFGRDYLYREKINFAFFMGNAQSGMNVRVMNLFCYL